MPVRYAKGSRGPLLRKFGCLAKSRSIMLRLFFVCGQVCLLLAWEVVGSCIFWSKAMLRSGLFNTGFVFCRSRGLRPFAESIRASEPRNGCAMAKQLTWERLFMRKECPSCLRNKMTWCFAGSRSAGQRIRDEKSFPGPIFCQGKAVSWFEPFLQAEKRICHGNKSR